MPRTKVKKVNCSEKESVQVKSEPEDTDSTNEFTLQTIILKGEMMKSAIKEVFNKRRQEVQKQFEIFRMQLNEPSNITEVSTLPKGTGATTPNRKANLSGQDNPDILQSKEMTIAKKVDHPQNEFMTPYNPTVVSSYNTFTPKVPPNVPLALIRRPKMGEILMSINGSPIMPNCADTEEASINIPMVDGTVMSIIPEEVLQIEDAPLQVDPQAKQHLKIVFDRLKCIVDENR